ncbi:MAG: sulfatase [Puniceicoccaceae bacterium]
MCRCLIPLALVPLWLVGSEQPNVIIIISDDQGWADIGYNNPKVYTPNLDALAATGATFGKHYVTPQCTPTRVALLTGRFPGRFGPQATQANVTPAFPLGTPTLASMFKEAGYSTFMSGKWHLGTTLDHRPGFFGFDSSYGSLTGGIGMYDHRYRKGKYEQSWFRDDAFIPGYENGTHATDLVAREAIRVIELDHQEPFFLYIPFQAPHTPLDERGPFINQPTQLDPDNAGRWRNEDEIKWFNDPEGIIQSEPDPEKRLYLAVVHHMDDAIGQIVAALERTGQRENTLILFASDNGPQVNWPGNVYPDDLKLTDINQPLPVRGMKKDVWEGGIHVPAFANWPGRIQQKQVDEVLHIVDWFPTLANLIEYEPEEAIPFDGVDFSQLLFDEGTLPDRELYWTWYNPFYPYYDRFALRYDDWKIVYYGGGEPTSISDWELYNLNDDPKEQMDEAYQFPDILADMHERYLRQRAKDRKTFYQKINP